MSDHAAILREFSDSFTPFSATWHALRDGADHIDALNRDLDTLRAERLKIAEDSALTKLQNVLSTVSGPVWVGPLHTTENCPGIPGGKIGRRYFFDKHEDSMSTAAEFDAASWAAWRTDGDDGGDNDPTEWGYSQGDAGFEQMDAGACGQLEAWGIEVRDAPSTEAPHG